MFFPKVVKFSVIPWKKTDRSIYWNLDSGILEIFAFEIRNARFWLQNAALGIQNSSNEWNPSSADKDLYLAGIRNPPLGIRDPISRLSCISLYGAKGK